MARTSEKTAQMITVTKSGRAKLQKNPSTESLQPRLEVALGKADDQLRCACAGEALTRHFHGRAPGVCCRLRR